jgi:hypothetical protein
MRRQDAPPASKGSEITQRKHTIYVSLNPTVDTGFLLTYQDGRIFDLLGHDFGLINDKPMGQFAATEPDPIRIRLVIANPNETSVADLRYVIQCLLRTIPTDKSGIIEINLSSNSLCSADPLDPVVT